MLWQIGKGKTEILSKYLRYYCFISRIRKKKPCCSSQKLFIGPEIDFSAKFHLETKQLAILVAY